MYNHDLFIKIRIIIILEAVTKFYHRQTLLQNQRIFYGRTISLLLPQRKRRQ